MSDALAGLLRSKYTHTQKKHGERDWGISLAKHNGCSLEQLQCNELHYTGCPVVLAVQSELHYTE